MLQAAAMRLLHHEVILRGARESTAYCFSFSFFFARYFVPRVNFKSLALSFCSLGISRNLGSIAERNRIVWVVAREDYS